MTELIGVQIQDSDKNVYYPQTSIEQVDGLKDELDLIKKSGDERNKETVANLESKGVKATVEDNLKVNIEKINNIETDPSSDTTAIPANLLMGTTAYSKKKKITGTMPSNGNMTKTLTNQGDVATVAKGYYTGGTVKANITNLIGSNVKKGIRVGGVLGTYSDTLSEIISIQSDSRINYSDGTRRLEVDKSLLERGDMMIVYNTYNDNWDKMYGILVSTKNPTKILSQFGTSAFRPTIVDSGSILTINLPIKGKSSGAINSGGYILLK